MVERSFTDKIISVDDQIAEERRIERRQQIWEKNIVVLSTVMAIIAIALSVVAIIMVVS